MDSERRGGCARLFWPACREDVHQLCPSDALTRRIMGNLRLNGTSFS